MRVLLAMYEAGELDPEPVELGPMPPNATRAMRAIAKDIQTRLGLRLADGVRDRLPYARSEAVNAGHCRASSSAGWALNKLVETGVLLYAGSLEPLGKPDGTKTYIPPGWMDLLPVDELAERRRRREGAE